MKKLLALTLSILILAGIIPLSTMAIDVEQINHSSNAHDILKTAIGNGIEGLSETAWSVREGASVASLVNITPTKVSQFTVRKNTDVWNDVAIDGSPDAYLYLLEANNNNAQKAITAYEQSESFKLSDAYGGKIPNTGILIRQSWYTSKFLSLTYTAESAGRIRLYDPTGAEITALTAVNGVTVEGFDTGKDSNGEYPKRGKLAVYINNTPLWSKDLNVHSRHFAWPEELQNITVGAGDKISIVIEYISGTGTVLALNPQIDYIETVEKPDSAYNCISEALRKDRNNGGSGALAEESNWKITIGSGIELSAGKFTALNYIAAGGWKATNPYDHMYGYNDKYFYHGIMPYSIEKDNIELKNFAGQTITAGEGVLVNTRAKTVDFEYVVMQGGKLRLYDEAGGNISVVNYIGSFNTCTQSKAGAKIMLNDTVVWDNGNAEFSDIAFPDLTLDVSEGDIIKIALEINSGGNSTTCVALNPQISYKTRETGDANSDGYVDIRDLVCLKKNIVNNAEYDEYCDLNGDSQIDTNDLVLMRKYLLGAINEFPTGQTKKKITSLKTTDAKTYMVRGEEALPFYGVYIRADQIAAGSLEAYFAKAAELGFQTVIVPIKWWWIENEMDVFDFSRVDTIYSYLEKYDLDIQILWYGSNNCGFYYDNVPAYVRNNTADYKLITRNNVKVLDYSNDLLVAREVLAVTALMNHIADIDTNQHLVAIQIENEPNACAPGSGGNIGSATTASEAEAMHFVGGQKAAILNLINKIGLAIKSSRYPCVTRVGFVSYSCYNEGNAAYIDITSEVLALEGVDIVGTNCFEPNTYMDNFFLTKNVAKPGNLPHIAEGPAGYASIFNKLLNAFSLGGGMLVYQLSDTGINGGPKYDSQSIYKITGEFAERDGTESTTWHNDTYYYAATSDWKAFNAMIKAVGSRIADTAVKDNFKVIDAMSANKSEDLTVGGKNFSYSTIGKPDNSYGTVGFIMQNTDGSYLLYSLKGGTTFTLPEGACVSSGRYVGDEWKSDETISLANNEFTVTADAAVGGTVYRVTF